MKRGLTDLVFILDKSGSMSGLEADTIGGYNSMLAKQKAVEGECRITTVLFNNNFELLYDGINIKEATAMTEKEYQVGGTTALLDAIGTTIHKIANEQKYAIEGNRAEKVMFVIITDGEENSSREYSVERIKAQIEKQKEEYGWEFVFLGANIDAVKTAGHYGITSDRAADYISDSEGTQLNYLVISQAIETFRSSGYIERDSFEEIHKDVKQRRNIK